MNLQPNLPPLFLMPMNLFGSALEKDLQTPKPSDSTEESHSEPDLKRRDYKVATPQASDKALSVSKNGFSKLCLDVMGGILSFLKVRDVEAFSLVSKEFRIVQQMDGYLLLKNPPIVGKMAIKPKESLSPFWRNLFENHGKTVKSLICKDRATKGSIIRAISENTPKIVELDLGSYTLGKNMLFFSDVEFNYLSKLKELQTLSRCVFQYGDINTFIENCKTHGTLKLQSLHCLYIDLDEADMDKLIHTFPLKNLEIARIDNDNSLLSLMKYGNRVTLLGIDLDTISPQTIQRVHHRFSNIKALHLFFYEKSLSEDLGKELGKWLTKMNFPMLTTLHLECLDNHIASALQNLPPLESLTIPDATIDNTVIACKATHSIETLDLSNYRRIEPEYPTEGDYFSNLRRITDEDLGAIVQGAASFKTLNLRNSSVTEGGILMLLQSGKSIENLILSPYHVGDSIIKYLLEGNLRIKTLKIDSKTLVETNEGASFTTLNLENTAITDKGIRLLLLSSKTIENLILSPHQIGDGIIQYVIEGNLRIRNIKIDSKAFVEIAEGAETIKTLNLENTAITDEGIRQLSQSSKTIETLIISSPHIGDRSIKYLAEGNLRIRNLNISSSKFTYACKQDLQKIRCLSLRIQGPAKEMGFGKVRVTIGPDPRFQAQTISFTAFHASETLDEAADKTEFLKNLITPGPRSKDDDYWDQFT